MRVNPLFDRQEKFVKSREEVGENSAFLRNMRRAPFPVRKRTDKGHIVLLFILFFFQMERTQEL